MAEKTNTLEAALAAQSDSTPQPSPAPVSGRKADRAKSLTTYTSIEGQRHMKRLAMDNDTTVAQIVREAVDGWLKANGHAPLSDFESG